MKSTRTLCFILFPLLIFNSCNKLEEADGPKAVQVPEVILVEGGTFTMGPSDLKHTPAHTVTVDDFYIGKTEVSAEEYACFLNDVGYIRKAPATIKGFIKREKVRNGKVLEYDRDTFGENLKDIYMIEGKANNIRRAGKGFIPRKKGAPANWVTYYGAVAYCEWLSKKTGQKYRLPTEAEWEYAALQLKEKVTGMPGGVWEWCSDWFGFYPIESKINPTGPSIPKETILPTKVIRGGNWVSKLGGGLLDSPSGVASAKSRSFSVLLGSGTKANYGFRVVRKEQDFALELKIGRRVPKLIRQQKARN